METIKKINLVKSYFEKRQDIAFAFLFGSVKNNTAHAGSDWDIGIYFKPENNRLKWEERRIWPQEADIFSHLVNIIGTDNIDLVVLNRASPDIADIIVRRGESLIIKDRNIFLEFLLRVSSEAEDYRNLVEEYYDIYERSSSLSREDRANLEKRIIFLENELKDFSYYKEYTFVLYEKDCHKKRELERWVENIINVVIDISKIIVSSNKITIPASYREVVEKMSFAGVEKDIISPLTNWTHLRNILAHEYLQLRWERIKDFLDKGEIVCNKFLKAVKNLLDR
ncbi:MAG: hypothetical protein B1H08_02855 [Candidatus Omnitrophica bacterium 4484_171]|nr:MAG: hypothetical protein B1H08_02855 [Candidatus Omnitrophica bacterium 4484_171]